MESNSYPRGYPNLYRNSDGRRYTAVDVMANCHGIKLNCESQLARNTAEHALAGRNRPQAVARQCPLLESL